MFWFLAILGALGVLAVIVVALWIWLNVKAAGPGGNA